jgi:glycosyltransferase involved in cell wall biosynthesis
LRILNVITGFNYGGAEMMLLKLCNSDEFSGCKIKIIVLSNKVLLKGYLNNRNIEVIGLDFSNFFSLPINFIKMFYISFLFRPQIIQTWLYHADFIGLILKLFYPKSKLVWNIRQANLSLEHNKASTLVIAKICSLFSHIFRIKIITNSFEAIDKHVQFGYNYSFFSVVPNGFDLNRFYPENITYYKIRSELNLKESCKIIGNFGRFHSLKNQIGFLETARLILDKVDFEVKFLMLGTDIDHNNLILSKKINELNLANDVILLGNKSDVDYYFKSLDLYISVSWGEAFPNVLGEAMASSVPCISTNVGDCLRIIGDEKFISKPGDYVDLSNKGISILNLNQYDLKILKDSLRFRIAENYNLDKVAYSYFNIYKNII